MKKIFKCLCCCFFCYSWDNGPDVKQENDNRG